MKNKKLSSIFSPLSLMSIFFVFTFFMPVSYAMQYREILSPAQIRTSSKQDIIEKYLEKKVTKFNYFLAGQVAVATSYDNSQYVGLVQDAVLFYPGRQKLDSSGLDITDKDQSDMFSLNASIRAIFTGPDIWKAKVLGRLDLGFIGIKNDVAGITNISNAYVSFLWDNTDFRFGHFFHPLAMDNVYPSPISGSEGLGYDPSRRGPILRIEHRIDKFAFVLAVAKVFDSLASTRAAMPDLFGQLNLKFSDKYLLGAGLNYHSEFPRLETDNGYKSVEGINGIAAFVFAKLALLDFLFKVRFTYIENGNNFGIMGSYSAASRNEVTDEIIYTPMRAAAFWTDIVFTRNKKVEPAIFIGFSENLGASKNIIKSCTKQVAGKDTDVSLININSSIRDAKYLFQLSPRIRTQVKDFIFGFETSYYRAAFAKSSLQEGWQDDYDCKGRIINSKPAGNVRLIFSSIYSF